MKLPRDTIRGRFLESLAQADLRFLVTTLAENSAQGDSLLKLLTDSGMRDKILQSDKLLDAVKNAALPLAFSYELYFFILLRRELKTQGLDSCALTAFVAEGLARFPAAPKPGVHTSDYVEALKVARDYDWFGLNVELANRTLFLSGMYADTLYLKKKSYPIAGLNYYENLGKTCYRAASRHQLANEFELCDVLNTLAENYIKIRTALLNVKDQCRKVIESGLKKSA